MSFYSKYILPKILNKVMQGKDKFRAEVVENTSGVVLEIGFGSGFNLSYYKNISKLYALEPSQELYDLGKERISKVSFSIIYLKESAEKISLPDNSIDSVVSTWTLCSIPNPQEALKEIRRVLKPGGSFYFIDHGRSPKKGTAFVQKVFTPFSNLCMGGCHLDRDIEKILLESGLKIQNMDKFYIEGMPLAFMYKGDVIK